MERVENLSLTGKETLASLKSVFLGDQKDWVEEKIFTRLLECSYNNPLIGVRDASSDN